MYTDQQNRFKEEIKKNEKLHGTILDQNALITQKDKEIGLGEKTLNEKERLIMEKDRIYANDMKVIQQDLHLEKERVKEFNALLQEMKID